MLECQMQDRRKTVVSGRDRFVGKRFGELLLTAGMILHVAVCDGVAVYAVTAAEPDAGVSRNGDCAVQTVMPNPGTMLDGAELCAEFYYYRDTLDAAGQQAYDLIRAGILQRKEKVRMTVFVHRDDIADIYKKVIYDGPELFWAEAGGARYTCNRQGRVTAIYPHYNAMAQDIADYRAKLEEAAAEALADMWSLSTDVEKAKYAHDWLTYHVAYDASAVDCQTAYSALVNRRTVCGGYAHGFQYLMQQAGIPCAYVVGYALGGYHAWNVVKLDDAYYAVDVTWDDPLGAAPGEFCYRYFNLTDQEIAADHIRAEISVPIPAAQGTACSYQNAFGGNAPGTDFDAIAGVMPERMKREDDGVPVGDLAPWH